jgi:hypothetical protein
MLNSIKPTYAMTCERKIHPDFKDFSKPSNWKTIDPQANSHLLQGMAEAIQPNKIYRDSMRVNQRLEKFQRNLKENLLIMATIHIDINNDGKKDTILKCDYDPKGKFGCRPDNPTYFGDYGRRNLYLINEDGTINTSESSKIPSNKLDFFIFKGRTFINNWTSIFYNRYLYRRNYEPGKGGGGIRVHDVSGRGGGIYAIPVCVIAYLNNKPGDINYD